MAKLLCKTDGQILIKLNKYLPYYIVIALLGTYSKKLKFMLTHVEVFIAAFFIIITKSRLNSTCLFVSTKLTVGSWQVFYVSANFHIPF